MKALIARFTVSVSKETFISNFYFPHHWFNSIYHSGYLIPGKWFLVY